MFIIKNLKKTKGKNISVTPSPHQPGSPRLLFLYKAFTFSCCAFTTGACGCPCLGVLWIQCNASETRRHGMLFSKGASSFKSPTWLGIQHFLSFCNCKYLPAYLICSLSKLHIWPASCCAGLIFHSAIYSQRGSVHLFQVN